MAARKAYTRHDGGAAPDDITDDVSQEYLIKHKDSYYNTKVCVNQTEAN